MDYSVLKKKGVSAVFWNMSGMLMRQGVTFVISIFLARLLSPGDFGLLGMATVFIAFTQGFSDFGMTAGLVQSKNPTNVQYSTVFYINLSISLLLMLIMIASSGLIARFYGNAEIEKIAKFLSFTFIVNAINGVQNAQIAKSLANKVKTIATLSSSICGGIIGITLAYFGYGVMSLVYSNIIGSIVNTIVIWHYSKWRPILAFNYKEVKPLLNFGTKIFASGILNTVFNKLDVLIIGKLFSPVTLGFYYRAVSLNQLVTKYSVDSLRGVFFSIISHLQDDKVLQLKVIKKSFHLVSFFTLLLMGLLYLNAKELIVILFSDKWLVSVDYFKVMVFYSFGYPISLILVNVISGNGYSAKFLELEIYKKLAYVVGCLPAIWFGINGFLWGMVFSTGFSVLLNMWFVGNIIQWTWFAQVKSFLLYAGLSVISAVIIYFTIATFEFSNLVLSLLFNSSAFIILYLLFNYLLKTNGFVHVLTFIVERLAILKGRKLLIK